MLWLLVAACAGAPQLAYETENRCLRKTGPPADDCEITPPTASWTRAVEFDLLVTNTGSNLDFAEVGPLRVKTTSAGIETVATPTINISCANDNPYTPPTAGLGTNCTLLVKRNRCNVAILSNQSDAARVAIEVSPSVMGSMSSTVEIVVANSPKDLPRCGAPASEESGLSTGDIVGIVAGACVGVYFLAMICTACCQ